MNLTPEQEQLLARAGFVVRWDGTVHDPLRGYAVPAYRALALARERLAQQPQRAA